MPINYLLISRELKLRSAEVLQRLWRPVLGTAAMAVSLGSLRGHFAPLRAGGDVVELLVLCAVGAAVYAAVVMLLWALADRPPGAETTSLQVLRTRLSDSVRG